MAIELYWGSGSPFAWRVMLTLEVKGLTYDSKLIEFSKGQHKTPEFLRLNPRGKVPTLKDGDFVIHESIAIMAYLDRKYPAPPLFGSTSEECGSIWRAISECESYLAPEADKVIRPLFFGKGLERIEEIQRAAQLIRDELRSNDAALAGSKWLVGARMSAADIVLFPVVQSLLRAASKEAAQPFDLGLAPLEKNYPNLGRWTRQVEALPNYQRTYPPHWKQ